MALKARTFEARSTVSLLRKNKTEYKNLQKFYTEVRASDWCVLYGRSGNARQWHTPCEHQRQSWARNWAEWQRVRKHELPYICDLWLPIQHNGQTAKLCAELWHMDPCNIWFNVCIVEPTNLGKTQFVTNLLFNPFCGKFDYVELICLKYAYNKTLDCFTERDPHLIVIICKQHEVEFCLKVVRTFFEGNNTHSSWWLCSLERRERVNQWASKAHLFSSPHRHQRVGTDPAALQHPEDFPRECCHGHVF